MATLTKHCPQCEADKPATPANFNRNKSKPDGMQSICRACQKVARRRDKAKIDERKKSYYQANKDKIVQYKQEHYIKNKEEINRKNNARYLARRDTILAKNREKYQKNRDEISKRNYKWASTHKDKIRTIVQRRAARKRMLPDTLTHQEWSRCLDYFKYCCAVCERPLLGLLHTVNCDHWIPLADPACPGTVMGNMIPLCGGLDGCNTIKRARPAAEWLTEKFGKRKAAAILARVDAYFAWVKSQPE